MVTRVTNRLQQPRNQASLPLKAGDLSREAETHGAWANACKRNGLLRDKRALAFKGSKAVAG